MATAAEQIVSLDAAIEARLTTGELVTEWSYNGRTVRFESLDSLMKLRSQLEKRAAREARAAGTGTMLARFRRPT